MNADKSMIDTLLERNRTLKVKETEDNVARQHFFSKVKCYPWAVNYNFMREPDWVDRDSQCEIDQAIALPKISTQQTRILNELREYFVMPPNIHDKPIFSRGGPRFHENWGRMRETSG